MNELFDVFLLEALLNGLLLGGVLALLSLGLNLIFGVIDVVWICYAELVMFGMYSVFFAHTEFGFPLVLAGLVGIAVVAVLGFLVHYIVISPILGTPPINQLLATGGLLFFLTSLATILFGIDFRNIGFRPAPIALTEDIYLSPSKLLSFGVATVAMIGIWIFLNRTYVGAAIRAISQDREIMVLMGVNQKRIYLITSAIAGGLAGLAACLLVLQYDVHPFIGLTFGPITFMICVLGGLGNMVGGFIAAFIFSELIAVGGFYFDLEWGYVFAFVFFIVMMFIRPEGILGEAFVMQKLLWVILAIAMCSIPIVGIEPYHLHVLILILIWSLAYTGWSVMGRFGLVSLGHGAFMGVGAYVTALLWNYLGVTPWIGIPIALALAAALAALVGYPCFRFKITGHYFALVTLALSEIVRLTLVATRDYTGGSLGFTPNRFGDGNSLYALQAADREVFFYAALLAWFVGLYIWHRVDKSMSRYALEAISEDEESAAAAGIHVTREKLMITMLSAVITAFAGVLYTQYQLFISPETVSGITISLQIVFAVIAGGLYMQFGPTIGAVFTIVLAETLRVVIGTDAIGFDNAIYGIMLVCFIIFLPKGILGGLTDLFTRGSRKEDDPPRAKPAPTGGD